MDEQFETRPLIDRETLRTLQQRRDAPTAIRLALHLGAILCTSALLVSGWLPLRAAIPAVIALAAMLATIFAPFHECTHRSAFVSRRSNAIGAWLTGTLWLLPPAVYRVFHFQHHRHTQDPEQDPELMGDAGALSSWPPTVTAWLKLIALHLLRLKVETMVRCAFLPESHWNGFAAWATAEERRACVRDSRLVLLFWAVIISAAVSGVPGMAWIIAAALLSHTFIGLWLTAEHRGLPYEGTIMARTRTTDSNAFVRWWTWNANYHAEHHAWPAIPWHQLPAAHALVHAHLEHHVKGYLPLHWNVLRQTNRPSCDPV